MWKKFVNSVESAMTMKPKDPQGAYPSESAYVDRGDFVVEIVRVFGLPKPDLHNSQDPFVKLYFVNAQRQRIPGCPAVYSTEKNDCDNAWFYCIRNLHYTPQPGDLLRIEAYSTGTLRNELLGSIDIQPSQLTGEQQDFTLQSNQYNNSRIVLRKLYHNQDQSIPRTKGFFLVRHGQSKWNDAQKNANFLNMASRDHGLTALGVSQALKQNTVWRRAQPGLFRDSSNAFSVDTEETPIPPQDAPYISKLACIDHVCSSPLTRAVQTALCCIYGQKRVQIRSLEEFKSPHPRAQKVVVPKISALQQEKEEIAIKPQPTKSEIQDVFALLNEPTDTTTDVNQENESSQNTQFSAPIVTAELQDDFLNLALESGSLPSNNAEETLSPLLSPTVELQEEQLEVGTPLVLRAALREVKNIAGLDTVGKCCGLDIPVRVEEELRSVWADVPLVSWVSPASSDIEARRTKRHILADLLRVSMDTSDAMSPWWTNMSSYDSDSAISKRLRGVLEDILYGAYQTPLLVGHSLLWRSMMNYLQIHPELAARKGHDVDNIRKKKLDNGVMAYVEISYDKGRLWMNDVHIMFDGKFHE